MADSPVPATSPETGFVDHASRVLAAATVAVLTLAICWVVEVANYGDDDRLSAEFGIRPHRLGSVWHIFTAPFLHDGLDHIMANSLPLVILGFLAALAGVGRFAGVSLIICVVSGLGVWFLAAPDSVTVGASGLIFGYFGYLLARGLVEHRALDIIVGVGVAVLYGGMLLGALPGKPGISWQAHLFGLIGGILAAWLLRRRA